MRLATRSGAADLTVPDGDPAAIREAARRMRHISGRALATHGVRGDSSVELTRVWTGDAAALAATELALLSGRSRRVLPHLEVAGSALATYADALEHAITRCRSLRARLADAHAEHSRRVALIRTSVADPLSCAAAVEAADRRLAEEVTIARRRHSAVMEEFHAAGRSCARTLSSLSASTAPAGAGSEAITGELIGNLSLIRQQIAAASVPPSPPPAEEPEWHETVLDNVLDAAAWTYNHTAVPLVNTAGNVIEGAAEHPEDLIEMAIGAGMIFLGAGGEVGGFALDATGVGAVAGVPINVASAGLIAGGATAFGQGAGRLVEHAQQKDHRWLQEVDRRSGRENVAPPTPLSGSEQRTLGDAVRREKLEHVFASKHKFQEFLRVHGSQEAAMEQIVRGLKGPDLPIRGRFEVTRTISGQEVVVRGAIVDGAPRIGTAFIR